MHDEGSNGAPRSTLTTWIPKEARSVAQTPENVRISEKDGRIESQEKELENQGSNSIAIMGVDTSFHCHGGFLRPLQDLGDITAAGKNFATQFQKHPNKCSQKQC